MIRLSGYVKISKIPTIWPGFYCSLSQLRLNRPLLGPCDHLNKLGDLLLFTGGELFTGLTQGGDNFRLLWLELAAGVAGGLATGDTGGAVTAGQAGKNAVENNALSDIAQAQSEGKTLEQKAGEYVEAENDRYKKANCGGMSAEACSVKMYEERREALKDMVSTGADFVPVVGTIKGAAEA